jgi:hypothetical protein
MTRRLGSFLPGSRAPRPAAPQFADGADRLVDLGSTDMAVSHHAHYPLAPHPVPPVGI